MSLLKQGFILTNPSRSHNVFKFYRSYRTLSKNSDRDKQTSLKLTSINSMQHNSTNAYPNWPLPSNI